LKKKQGLLIYALVGVFTLSTIVGSPARLFAFGANAATTSSLSTSFSRVLVKGSIGNDVKLLQTLLNNEGFNLSVDGSFGSQTLKAVKEYQKKNGLKVDGFVGPQTSASLMSKMAQKPAEPTKPAEPSKPVEPAKPVQPTKPVESTKPVAYGKTTLKVGRADYASHGTKSFANAVVVLAGDKIVASSIDEYQFMAKASNIGVPNSDTDFGKNYADPDMVLGSKLVNAEAYSKNMATRGGSTVSIDKNFKAIEEYVKGKTVAELEKTLANNTVEQMVDVISGATLVDNHGYVAAIVAAAKLAKENSAFTVDTFALDHLTITRADYAAHGTKSFANAVVILAGDKVVASSIEEYQFMAKASNTGVPNSDTDFGKNYADPNMVLASKLVNVEAYSKNMATRGGSTISLDNNWKAIETYVAGKTVAQLEKILSTNTPEQMVDAVSGATLVDNHGYVAAIVAAAKLAK